MLEKRGVSATRLKSLKGVKGGQKLIEYAIPIRSPDRSSELALLTLRAEDELG